MISKLQAARGKVVYPQGSFAPTRGTVNPAGYLKRELRKSQQPRGRDGLSDKRSGLARRALKRKAGAGSAPMNSTPAALGGKLQMQQQQQQLMRTQVGNAPLLSGQPANKALAQQLGMQQQTAGILPGEGQGQTLPTGTKVPEATPTGTAPPNAPGQVNVNANGTLDLPYNQEYSGEILSALEESNKGLLDLNIQSQTQAGEYVRNKRDIEQGYGEAKRQSLNQNAGAGTAFSSAYGLAVGNNARDYSNQSNDLETANTAFSNSINMQRGGITEAFNRRLQNAAMASGNVAAEDAGTLGYGQSAAVPVKPGPGDGSGRSNLGNKGKGKGKGKGHGGKGKGHGGKGKGKDHGIGKPKGPIHRGQDFKPHKPGKNKNSKKPIFGNTGRKTLAKRAIVKARSK